MPCQTLTLAISICSLRSWQIFSEFNKRRTNAIVDLPLFPTALLPSIIPVNAIACFLMMCPTNRICLLTITFRRFLDVLALWSTSSFDTLSVHAIRNIRRKKHIFLQLPTAISVSLQESYIEVVERQFVVMERQLKGPIELYHWTQVTSLSSIPVYSCGTYRMSIKLVVSCLVSIDMSRPTIYIIEHITCQSNSVT